MNPTEKRINKKSSSAAQGALGMGRFFSLGRLVMAIHSCHDIQ
jgi:hypothetical protein